MDSSSSINVTIKQLDGNTFSIKCTTDISVLGLKTLIADARDITVDRQRLIFRAQELQDEQLLTHYNVIDGSILHIVIRPIGNNPNVNMASALQPEGQHVVDMGNQNVYGGIGSGPFGNNNRAPVMMNGNEGVHGVDVDVLGMTKLCRFIKIFALIDAVFLILYGLTYTPLLFLLAVFAFAGYFGAKNLSRFALIAYIICLILEVAGRIYMIYANTSAFEIILLVLMILIDGFVIKCTFQLWKAVPALGPEQRDQILVMNRMSLC